MLTVSAHLALKDLASSFDRFYLILLLGWQDIRQRYRRSKLGPFWLTISMSVMITTIGLLFSQIFKAPIKEFLPYFALGTIYWTLYSITILESCDGFVQAEGIIKELPIPLSVHILRIFTRNIIIFFHNLLILPFLFLVLGKTVNSSLLLGFLGTFLVLLNMFWISLVLSVICTRFRDLTQIVNSIQQILFYLTPIFWMPSVLPNSKLIFLLNLNPIYHFLNITRAPIMGEPIHLTSWYVCLGLAFFGFLFALVFYGKFKNRIAYWV